MSKEPEDLDVSVLLKFIDDWLNRYDVCNIDYNFYKIKQALQRLEAIYNTKPSEALEALKELRVIANMYCSFNGTQCEHNKELADIIEKSLLKQQEPKHYLKWEDLEFKTTHKIRILMNDNLYNLFCYDEKYIEIRTIKGEFMLTLNNDNPEDKQFFNDLRLEMVE